MNLLDKYQASRRLEERYVDQELSKRLSDPTLIEPMLSEDDCNFAMHYLSGQCEELTAEGVNVTMVCEIFWPIIYGHNSYTQKTFLQIQNGST
jgi:hypothetical protein